MVEALAPIEDRGRGTVLLSELGRVRRDLIVQHLHQTISLTCSSGSDPNVIGGPGSDFMAP